MDVDRLRIVAVRLETLGVETSELRSLELEVAANERPPGLLGKFRRKATATLLIQWSNFRGEVGETGEAFALLASRVNRNEPLAPEETDKVRAQLLDFVKVVPAGVFAAANAALPIPGTSVLTPFLLVRMGLMPSRWRDAHVLETLRKEAERMRTEGHGTEADELDSIRTDVEAESDHRETVALNAGLLTRWDTNANGIWDEDEKTAYRKELARLRGLLSSNGPRKEWFLCLGSEVWGPLRISEMINEAEEMDEDLLICHDGRSGWVDLQDLKTGEAQV